MKTKIVARWEVEPLHKNDYETVEEVVKDLKLVFPEIDSEGYYEEDTTKISTTECDSKLLVYLEETLYEDTLDGFEYEVDIDILTESNEKVMSMVESVSSIFTLGKFSIVVSGGE